VKNNKVLIALSGGVDSSVSAILLKEKGYDLIGVTLIMSKLGKYRIDPLSKSIKDASILASRLQIPYYVFDVNSEFEQIVIHNFISEYYSGRTPNPCTLCNPEIKWKSLLEIANAFDCEYLATGHYAQINENNGRFYISKAKDEIKDQSYFLWRLNQNQLRRTIFPIGKYEKDEIKRIADEKGFKTIASKKESYNICFIPEGDYRSYLKMHLGVEYQSKSGEFISNSGKILGVHAGIENYTIGQYRGLEATLEEPMYVLRINSSENSIVIGPKHELMQKKLTVKCFNLTKYSLIPQKISIRSKLNYKSSEIKCKIVLDNQQLNIQLEEPAFAICPGQSIAFYEGNDLIGGGIIA
jgi:tRNA-uridine 2-sulfurtransferase